MIVTETKFCTVRSTFVDFHVFNQHRQSFKLLYAYSVILAVCLLLKHFDIPKGLSKNTRRFTFSGLREQAFQSKIESASKILNSLCFLEYVMYFSLIYNLFLVFSALGRADEAAMVQFSMASRKPPEERVQNLKKCVEAFNNPMLSSYSKAVTDCIDLLERQIAIEVVSINL